MHVVKIMVIIQMILTSSHGVGNARIVLMKGMGYLRGI